MLNLDDGKPIGIIATGKNKREIIYLDPENKYQKGGYDKINLKKDKILPLLDVDERQIAYVAGPSGSGKSTYASALACNYRKVFPKRDIYIFSRTDAKNDPAYAPLKPLQIDINQDLVDNPIDIETDIKKGSLVIFDDCGTIRDEKIKKAVNHLMIDIMEVGRKLGIWIIITSHLVNPTDRKLGRVIMNELQTFTFFPKSGSAYQISYCLKNYFGMSKKQIDDIFNLNSRWVTVLRNYPITILHEHGAYIL